MRTDVQIQCGSMSTAGGVRKKVIDGVVDDCLVLVYREHTYQASLCLFDNTINNSATL